MLHFPVIGRSVSRNGLASIQGVNSDDRPNYGCTPKDGRGWSSGPNGSATSIISSRDGGSPSEISETDCRSVCRPMAARDAKVSASTGDPALVRAALRKARTSATRSTHGALRPVSAYAIGDGRNASTPTTPAQTFSRGTACRKAGAVEDETGPATP